MMARTNVYNYADDDARAYGEEDTLTGWFNPDSATLYKEDTEWDGSNHISLATGSQFDHEALYRTKGGRWVLNTWSQWEGKQERYEFVNDATAKDWLLRNNEDDAVAQWFGELEEEFGPSKGGRPAVGPAISVAYPQSLLDRIDAATAAANLTRAEWLRNAAEHALQAITPA
jgi:hypothetical protein